MYRGGKICLSDHFKPLWARNVPKFGISHALALGVSFFFIQFIKNSNKIVLEVINFRIRVFFLYLKVFYEVLKQSKCFTRQLQNI